MKNMMIKTAVLTALLCMAALLPACSPETGSSESTPVSAQTSQTSSQSGGMRDDPSSEPEDSSSDAGGESSEDSSGQNSGILPDISADDPAFVRLFAENPIDRDYANEVETAASTGQMLAVNNRYIDLWKAEVDGAYRTLLKRPREKARKRFRKNNRNGPRESEMPLPLLMKAHRATAAPASWKLPDRFWPFTVPVPPVCTAGCSRLIRNLPISIREQRTRLPKTERR